MAQKYTELFIAEVALSHDGSLPLAMWYIDKLGELGVKRIKFQCHVADSEPWQKWRTEEPPWPFHESRSAYLRRTAFNYSQWTEIADRCHNWGAKFMCSVFCPDAIDAITHAVDEWKVPHTLAHDRTIAGLLSDDSRPCFVSTTPDSELFVPYASAFVLDCLPSNLNPVPRDLAVARAELTTHDGISYHCASSQPAIAAIRRGKFAEAHVMFLPGMRVPDADWSLSYGRVKRIMDTAKYWDSRDENKD